MLDHFPVTKDRLSGGDRDGHGIGDWEARDATHYGYFVKGKLASHEIQEREHSAGGGFLVR